MKYFIAAVIIITFLFQIFIKPSDFINNLKVSYLNKKYALDEFNSIKEAYEKIIFCIISCISTISSIILIIHNILPPTIIM